MEDAQSHIRKAFKQRKHDSGPEMLREILKKLVEMEEESKKCQRPVCGIVKLLSTSCFFAVIVTWCDDNNVVRLSMAYYLADIAIESSHWKKATKGVLLASISYPSICPRNSGHDNCFGLRLRCGGGF